MPRILVLNRMHLDEWPSDQVAVILESLKDHRGITGFTREAPDAGWIKRRGYEGNITDCFPGSPIGNREQRDAWQITRIAQQADLVLDIHGTGNNGWEFPFYGASGSFQSAGRRHGIAAPMRTRGHSHSASSGRGSAKLRRLGLESRHGRPPAFAGMAGRPRLRLDSSCAADGGIPHCGRNPGRRCPAARAATAVPTIYAIAGHGHPRPWPAHTGLRLRLGRGPLLSYGVLGRGSGALPRTGRENPARPR